MDTLLAFFLIAASFLWISTFGYVVALATVERWRRRATLEVRKLPDVAVIVPTLNEQSFVAAKLRDIRSADYPRERMRIVVVDGGSSDRTAALVQTEAKSDPGIDLVHLPGAKGQPAQILHALHRTTCDIAVVTDADARLEPSCIRRLVSFLLENPGTAVAGAFVEPETPLLEERMHWWLQNRLWWLEGEAFSSALVSGVCYAVRPRDVLPLAIDARAMDISVALTAAARGRSARMCPTAHATELRTPQTAAEFIGFRRRRGRDYLADLRATVRLQSAPARIRLACAVRIWHFVGTPLLALGVTLAGMLLAAAGAWGWPLAVAAGFALPALGTAAASTLGASIGRPIWRLSAVAGRCAGLTWLSLVGLEQPPTPVPLRED